MKLKLLCVFYYKEKLGMEKKVLREYYKSIRKKHNYKINLKAKHIAFCHNYL